MGLLNNRNVSCYANSLVQQFFMMPQMRSALFRFPASESTPIALELQSLFSFLQRSERHHYDPMAFLKLFSDRLDPNQQQDANEFFTLLTDRLEHNLAKSGPISPLGSFLISLRLS